MSGTVAYRFESSVSAAGAQDKGIGVSDALVNFGVSEDLGGGLKLSASTGIDIGGNENKGTISRGVNISLATANMGSVTFSSDEGSDYLPIDFFATTAGGHNGSSADRIIYSTPDFNGAKLTVVYADDTGNTTDDAAGAHGVGQTTMAYIVDYAIAGATINYTSVTTDAALNSIVKEAKGFKVGYDFGIAKATYGAYTSTSAANVETKEKALQVTAPVGPIALSVVLGSTQSGTSAKLNGNQITATYALSKRTNVALDLVKYDSATAGVSPARTRMTLTHNF